MKVIEIRAIEDCFGGSQIRELILSDEITEKFLYKLSKDCILQYFPHFTKPFFKIRKEGLYDIKGIVGNKSLRIYIKNSKKISIFEIIEIINNFQ